MPVLVSGATGQIGRHLVQQLLATGASVRALSRRPEKAELPAGVEVLAGDLTAAPSPAIFEGVERLFLFAAEGRVAPFLAAARGAGVRQVVALSSLAAADAPGSWSGRHHVAFEAEVRAAGIPATLLRPGTYATNLLAWAPVLRAGDVVEGPYARSAQAPIHQADVAAVAVCALTQGGHAGAIYPLSGPQALTRAAQLDAIGEATGRQLRYSEIAPDAWAAQMSRFMPAELVKMLLDHWRQTVEVPDAVLPTVEQVTGRPARSLLEWAKDHAAAFRRG
jgi:uncharacterized protein YbjT (DUF2867 family)